ncbi:MAG: hypothetical protein AB7U20_13590 [Planctomycetaceae bacterium]
MAISRKKILQKIDGKRKAIEYHLSEHIPQHLGSATVDLMRYWHKEVSHLIDEMERWALRLTKHDELLAQSSAYRKRLEEVLTRSEP